MGIGTGSLSSDVELFEVGGDTDRNDMVRESMELIQSIWDGEPPYSIEGKYWNVKIEDMARSEFGVGHLSSHIKNRVLLWRYQLCHRNLTALE